MRDDNQPLAQAGGFPLEGADMGQILIALYIALSEAAGGRSGQGRRQPRVARCNQESLNRRRAGNRIPAVVVYRRRGKSLGVGALNSPTGGNGARQRNHYDISPNGRPWMAFSIECEEFKPVVRNTLRGFATIKVPDIRMRVKDVAIHVKNGSQWAALPAKPQIRDGQVITKDGKAQYVPILEFTDRNTGDAFSRAVIDAVLRAHPQALGAANG
jgi:hypothetical protein